MVANKGLARDAVIIGDKAQCGRASEDPLERVYPFSLMPLSSVDDRHQRNFGVSQWLQPPSRQLEEMVPRLMCKSGSEG